MLMIASLYERGWAESQIAQEVAKEYGLEYETALEVTRDAIHKLTKG